MEELSIASVSRQGLSDAVRQGLTELILNGTLKPGDTLPSERILARRFGVSKPTVREALRQLAAVGAITIAHGKLPTVRGPSSEPLETILRFALSNTKDGLREAMELRRALETEIATLAAERAVGEVKELDEALNRMEQAMGTVDPWVEADVSFHIALARCSGNSLMLYLVEALGGLVTQTIRLLHLYRGVDNVAPTLQRHRQVAEAVRRGDPVAARAAMITHFDATEPFLSHVVA